MPRGGDRTLQALANGKKIGRPRKAAADFDAKNGIASVVLRSFKVKEHYRALVRADLPANEIAALPIGERKLIAEVLRDLNDVEFRDKKVPQAQQPGGAVVRVIVEHMGRHQDQASTKAK